MSTSLHTDCRIIFGIPYEYRYKDLRQHPHKQARFYESDKKQSNLFHLN